MIHKAEETVRKGVNMHIQKSLAKIDA
jgi:hypothetical protein